MWNRTEKLNGRVRARSSRWFCGQLVLQVEADLFDLLPEGDHLREVFVGTSWRDARVSDLNDVGYLSSDREHMATKKLKGEQYGLS